MRADSNACLQKQTGLKLLLLVGKTATSAQQQHYETKDTMVVLLPDWTAAVSIVMRCTHLSKQLLSASRMQGPSAIIALPVRDDDLCHLNMLTMPHALLPRIFCRPWRLRPSWRCTQC